MISYIEINGLYGMYDYTIQLTRENPVFVMTGPNGFGKTTILRVINYLCECNFWYFYNLQFTSIIIRFKEPRERESSFILEHVSVSDENVFSESENIPSTNLRITYKLLEPQEKVIEEFLITSHDYERKVRDIDRRYVREYYDDKQVVNESLVIQSFDISEDSFLQRNARNIILYFENKHCCFIKEQRIISFSQNQLYNRTSSFVNRYSINDISDKIRQFYTDSQRDYVRINHSIDSTFISRLLSQNFRVLEANDYLDRIKKLKEKTDCLNHYKLLIDNVQLVEEYDEKYKDVLSLHLQDMEQKLSSFDVPLHKLGLFSNLVSKNVLSNKKMNLDYRGISIVTDNGTKVPLSKLSSGEQNLIILYYRLVFDTSPGTVLLIDEPENSLHMAWLENMLNDYIEVADTTNCQILIATHSPAFINGRWQLTYDLFENNKHVTNL